jgi:hypothetical protein
MTYELGLRATFAGLVSSSMLGQSGTSSSPTFDILSQLGVFAVVIVVFKFMLGRQDQRDEKAEKHTTEHTAHLLSETDRLHKELAEERDAHEETRKQLVHLLTQGKDKQS